MPAGRRGRIASWLSAVALVAACKSSNQQPPAPQPEPQLAEPTLDPEGGQPAKLEVFEVVTGSKQMKDIYRRVLDEIQADHAGASDTRIVSERLVSEEHGVGIEIDIWRGPDGKTISDWYLTAEDRDVPAEQVLNRYVDQLASEQDRSGRYPYRLAADQRWGFAALPPEVAGGPGRARTYLLAAPAALDSTAVESARAETQPDTNAPVVRIELTEQGSAKFAELTERALGNKIAIAIEGTLQSVPVVMNRIDGGTLVLTVGPGPEAAMRREAERLAASLTGSH